MTKLLDQPDAQPFTARLAAAGSRRSELEALLLTASCEMSSERLRELVLIENVGRKRSEASRQKVWRQLRERYLMDPSVAEYRAFVDVWQSAAGQSERGLLEYLMMARVDRTFRELTQGVLAPLAARLGSPVDTQLAMQHLDGLLAVLELDWSDSTRKRVSQHALSALTDFGVLEGGTRKRTVRINPGPTATLFAAQLGRLAGLTDVQILDSVWFSLLGCDRAGTSELLFAAHRAGALAVRMQAEVVELELPGMESP